jgi:hypothetical protein
MVALNVLSWIMGGMNYHANSGSFRAGHNIKRIIGKKFGRLLVIDYGGQDKHKNVMWKCLCDCGTEGIFKGRNLRIGKTKSCGCWYREVLAAGTNRKHGHTSRKTGATPEYYTWKNMRNRCQNPEARDWKDYGGRGVKVCERWEKFENFLEDMGIKPSRNLTIERIDNSEGYSKANCIWATRRIQNRNKRNNVVLVHNGKCQTLMDWANELGISFNTLTARLRLGWTVAQTLSTPVLRKADT